MDDKITEFPISPEQRAFNVISSADSFESLVNAIDEIARIKGADGHVYSADELIDAIESVRTGDKTLNHITRTSGLRDKVAELLSVPETTELENTLPEEVVGRNSGYETIAEQETIKKLLGRLFQSDNVNQVYRPGVYTFTAEQLDQFLNKYPSPGGLVQLRNDIMRSYERQIEVTDDSIERAAIRDLSIPSLESITDQQLEEAERVMYSG
jgi:regulator of replication initiation timing